MVRTEGFFSRMRSVLDPLTNKKDIHYVGLDLLGASESFEVKRQMNACYKRVKRTFPNAFLKLHLKQHHKTGERKKHSFVLHVEQDRKVLASAKQADWNLAKALQETITKVENSLQHHYKTQGKKRRG